MIVMILQTSSVGSDLSSILCFLRLPQIRLDSSIRLLFYINRNFFRLGSFEEIMLRKTAIINSTVRLIMMKIIMSLLVISLLFQGLGETIFGDSHNQSTTREQTPFFSLWIKHIENSLNLYGGPMESSLQYGLSVAAAACNIQPYIGVKLLRSQYQQYQYCQSFPLYIHIQTSPRFSINCCLCCRTSKVMSEYLYQ